MTTRYFVSYVDEKVEDLVAVSKVEYTNNWVIFTMNDGTILRLNVMHIVSILIHEE